MIFVAVFLFHLALLIIWISPFRFFHTLKYTRVFMSDKHHHREQAATEAAALDLSHSARNIHGENKENQE